jgi:DNA-binding LacI/PurR family transcriptional regulator
MGDQRRHTGRRPTIRDVAERADVSVATVSYVVNRTRSVAEGTRSRVQAAISELGYEPNSAARGLKSHRVATIGLVVPDLLNQFFATLVAGLESAAAERDVLVVLCSTEGSQEREAHYARLLRGRRMDGVVYLTGTGRPPASLVKLASDEPVVFVDERLPGVEVPFVGVANRSGARDVMRAVLAAGHERIGIIGGPPALWTAEQRLAGYREALAAAGIDPDTVPLVAGDYREPSGHTAAAELLDRAEPPTAIVAANDLMAIGALTCARERGLHVPRDLSIAGFDDIPLARLLQPALTTVRQPAWELGREAAELLFARIDDPSGAPGRTELPAELVQRDSVIPPSSTTSPTSERTQQ